MFAQVFSSQQLTCAGFFFTKDAICLNLEAKMGFLGGSVVKYPPANAGDEALISGSGKCPREGNGNPL